MYNSHHPDGKSHGGTTMLIRFKAHLSQLILNESVAVNFDHPFKCEVDLALAETYHPSRS